MAQELEEIYPELVSQVVHPIYNDKQELIGKETYKSVNYIGLISELTAAINELNAKIKYLEGQLEPRVVYGEDFTAEEKSKITRNGYQLLQNTPNPFSDRTLVSYTMPEGLEKGAILVFNLNGRMLQRYDLDNNKGVLNINASELDGAGMYIYTLLANGQEIITKRMILE